MPDSVGKSRPSLLIKNEDGTKEVFNSKACTVNGNEVDVMQSEDMDAVSSAIGDYNVEILKTIQDKLQEINGPDANFNVSAVDCEITVDIEATKTAQHGIIIKFNCNENKTKINMTLKASLVAK